jgi:hypothetical protein
MIATTEDVNTKRFTLFPCFRAEFRIDVVPRTAGMMSSEYISVGTKGKLSGNRKGHTVRLCSLEVKWRGGVSNDVDISDGLIKSAILSDIFDNDELKPIGIVGKPFCQEGALG